MRKASGYTMCSHIFLQISTKSTPNVIDKWWESLHLPLVPDETYLRSFCKWVNQIGVYSANFS